MLGFRARLGPQIIGYLRFWYKKLLTAVQVWASGKFYDTYDY